MYSFQVLTGSRARSLSNESSDFDYRGIFLRPASADWKIEKQEETFSKKVPHAEGLHDVEFYHVRHFLRVANAGSPEFVEMMYCHQSKMDMEMLPFAEQLKKYRHLFLTQKLAQKLFMATGDYHGVNPKEPVVGRNMFAHAVKDFLELGDTPAVRKRLVDAARRKMVLNHLLSHNTFLVNLENSYSASASYLREFKYGNGNLQDFIDFYYGLHYKYFDMSALPPTSDMAANILLNEARVLATKWT